MSNLPQVLVIYEVKFEIFSVSGLRRRSDEIEVVEFVTTRIYVHNLLVLRYNLPLTLFSQI